MSLHFLLAMVLVSLVISRPVAAGQATLAVAANFTFTMRTLASNFEQQSGHRLVLSYGSTGKLYAQIRQGAPFDLFLSADQERPARLEEGGFGVPGTRFTYAQGRLVLWSPRSGYIDSRGEVLKEGDFLHLAIANPDTAPYGAAALQTLASLGLEQMLGAKLVYGDNIAQTYQFVFTGNAELGFVALSQLHSQGGEPGSSWLVPQEYYDPIRQDALLLPHGRDSEVARAFLDYLRSAPARRIIEAAGYDIPAN